MTQTSSSPTGAAPAIHLVLVPGFWLGAWAWDDVVAALADDTDLVTHAVTLPGLESADADRTGLTLDDHVRAVLDLVEGLDGDVVLVGHSGGGMVVQHVVDRAPERVRRVVYVDSGPMLPGAAIAPDATGADHPLPSWEELEAGGGSTDGLDDAARERMVRLAVPHPAGVASAPADPHDPRRFDVPATVICTSLTADVLHQVVAAGQMPAELPELRDVTYVDLPTGHWPQLSRPADLAEVIAAAARA